MKRKVVSRILRLLALCVLAMPCVAQVVTWQSEKMYKDYQAIYGEKNPAKKAELAEKFLSDYKSADPVALTHVYQVMFYAYAESSNWTKVLETYDRISLATKLTDSDKQRLEETVRAAGDRKR